MWSQTIWGAELFQLSNYLINFTFFSQADLIM